MLDIVEYYEIDGSYEGDMNIAMHLKMQMKLILANELPKLTLHKSQLITKQ